MGYQPFLIAAPRVGLERDLEPWLLPNDAYPTLEDCYLFRGRIKKKEGYRVLDRLHYVIATVGAGPNVTTISFTIPGVGAGTHLTPFQSSFVFGTVIFTDNGANGFFQTDGGVGSSINYTNGNVTLNVVTSVPAGTKVLYYPGLPTMGLPTLQNNIAIESGTTNKEILMGFDTKFSYLFDGTTLSFIGKSFYKTTGTAFNWTGTDADFFWTTNYLSCMWASNFVPGFQNSPEATTASSGDGIRWFDQDQSGWVNFLPPLDSTGSPSFLQGALILLPYKGRLVALNTWEGISYAARKNFPQRARWSQLGTPFAPSTAPVPSGFTGVAVDNAWFSDAANPGLGGFFDAPTLEMIVSAQFVKDTLIVFFESSTWQLRYTGNELLPFAWEKINTELGASSTFSEVPFDKIVLGIGDVGIHACDSVNVERIDQRIPNEVFYIQNTEEGRSRVYGIRDYYNELVYWTIPYVGPSQQQAVDDEIGPIPPSGVPIVYPNKILTYNYVDQAYSFFNDSFTCFGYYSKADGDALWSSLDTWQEAVYNWVPGTYQESFQYVVAGNQQGYVEIFDPELTYNGPSLLISDVTGIDGKTITCVNHNLPAGTTIRVRNGTAFAFFKILSVTSANVFVTDATASNQFPGIFSGDADITVISNINIITKRFNPFINEGAQVRLGFVDFYVNRTTSGQFSVNIYLDEDTTLPTNRVVVASFPETTYTTSPDTAPYLEQKLWKRAYFENISQLFQIQITLNDAQLRNLDVIQSDFTLQGMILWFDKSGRLINV